MRSIALPLGMLCVLLAAPSQVLAQAEIHELPADYVYPAPAWSPYVVGALIGVLVMLTLLISKKKVGASSAYAAGAGMIGRVVAPRYTESRKFFQKKPPVFGWSIVFVLGALGGSFLAAWTGGELTGTFLQDLWVARFGEESYLVRTFVALAGGVLMAYGARMAGGCTSGHGISGTMQLAVGSWIAVSCFFVGGIAMAMLIYRL